VGRAPAARSYDAMIAAVAVANDLPLSTCKPDDVAAIEQLQIIDVPTSARDLDAPRRVRRGC